MIHAAKPSARLIALVVLLAAAACPAAIISYTDSVASSTTDWDTAFSLPKFDPALGDLVRITWRLEGSIDADVRIENTSPFSATSTRTTLTVDLTLTRPNSDPIMVITAERSTEGDLAPYDDAIDFAGFSGVTYTPLQATNDDSVSSTASADLALFTAAGAGETINLPVLADARSCITGGGNLISNINTAAAAQITITYEFTPEPATVVLLALGAAIHFRRRTVLNARR